MIYFGPNFFLQLVDGGFDVRVLCVIVQPPKPTFLLNEVQDGLTNRRFGVIAAVHFRCGCIDCLDEFVTLGDRKFLQFVLCGYVCVYVGQAVFQCVV